MHKIDKDRRLEWLRALRRFKYGIKVRAKLGILQTVCEQVAVERRGKHQWDAPHWTHDEWITFLYNCIKNDEYPPKLLEAFAKTAEITFLVSSTQPTDEKTIAAVDTVCKWLSRPLRDKFGVFVEETQDE
jgi:hypothetical protein